jgi:hypothetical protein
MPISRAEGTGAEGVVEREWKRRHDLRWRRVAARSTLPSDFKITPSSP